MKIFMTSYWTSKGFTYFLAFVSGDNVNVIEAKDYTSGISDTCTIHGISEVSNQDFENRNF